MEKMYTENDQLYLKIQQDALWSSNATNTSTSNSSIASTTTTQCNSDGESPLTNADPLSPLIMLASATGTTPSSVPALHFYENENQSSKIKVVNDRCIEEVDLYSTMYHQHLVAPNESIVCIKPENIMLQDPSPSSSAIEKMIIVESDSFLSSNNDNSQSSYEEIKYESIIVQNEGCGNNKKRKQIALEQEHEDSVAKNSNSSNSSHINCSSSDDALVLMIENKEDVVQHYRTTYSASRNNNEQQSSASKKQRCLKKRTVTSYDSQTSFYLKSVFFEVYSCQSKLTKQQRLEVQKKTGLPPRNITYWFSNHKRRFQNTLKIYRKIVQEANGAIKNYCDFIKWRKERGLPEQISQEEVKQLEEIEQER